MFYKNKIIKKKVETKNIKFANFEKGMDTNKDSDIMPYTIAKITYNYNIKNGCLEDGIGFKALCLPKTTENLSDERLMLMEHGIIIKKIWHYKFYDTEDNKPKHQIIVYTESGMLYWFKLIGLDPYMYPLVQSSLYPNGVPNAINYNIEGVDYMIFSSASDGMWKYTNNNPLVQIQDGPCMKSMCLHYDRLFAIMDGDTNKLIYSTNINPTDWDASEDEANYVIMRDERGAVNKVVSFNDYVYIFRDFGVAKLSAYGESINYSISQLFVSSSKIYGESVCVCGDRIILMARDGIHEFDGRTTKKLNLGIEKLFEGVTNEKCCTLYYNGKYYLACRLNFDDQLSIGCENYVGGYINNALIELDLSDYSINLTRGVDICSMLTIDDGNFCKVVACFNGEHSGKLGEMTRDGKIFGTPLKKVWTSPNSDMGYSTKIKRIKSIIIKSNNECNVNFSSEKQSKTYILKASSCSKKFPVNICGEQISISFVSENNDVCKISCPEINFVVEK